MIKVEDIYPITVIKYPDGKVSMDLILDSHLQQYTPPITWYSLEENLRGQTRALEGVYASDVEMWLNNGRHI